MKVDNKMRSACRVLFLLLIGLLSACQGEQVGSGLDQNRANHMVAALSARGIGAVARKEAGGRGTFGVWVEKSARGEAAVLIDEQGLLEKGSSSFEDLISNQGILPSSREVEQLKVDRAVAIEVERLIENIPGVVSARAIVRQSFLKESEQPTVSVVIEDESEAQGRQEQFAAIVLSAVPGVLRDRILIAVEHSKVDNDLRREIGILNIKGKPIPLPLENFLGIWRVPKDDYSSLAYTLVALIAACIFIGGIIGYWYGWYVQSKGFIEQNSNELIVPKVTRMDILKDSAKVSSIDLTGGEWTQKS